MAIVDFLDMSLEERHKTIVANAKYLGFTKQNNTKVALYLLYDAFVEVFYDAKGKTIEDIDIMRSDQALDMYIYTMLLEEQISRREYRKKLDADESMRNFKLFQNLLHMKQEGMLDKYKAICLPADDMGALKGKNMPFMAIRQREYVRRTRNEKQTTLNIYLNLYDLNDTGDEYNDIYLPGHPRLYEREGDEFLLMGFAWSDFIYLRTYLYKWHVNAVREEPIHIWSDKSLEHLYPHQNIQP